MQLGILALTCGKWHQLTPVNLRRFWGTGLCHIPPLQIVLESHYAPFVGPVDGPCTPCSASFNFMSDIYCFYDHECHLLFFCNQSPFMSENHYWKQRLCRVQNSLPSVKNQALGKELHSIKSSLPSAGHSANTGTRPRTSLPSARLSAKSLHSA